MTAGEQSTVGRWFAARPDWQLVALLLGAIYAAYVASGLALGYSVRGQVNAVANLTFYVAVFGMVALALNLHWGYTGLFNIGVVGFMAVGIYTMAVLVKPPLSADPTASVGGFGLPLPVGAAGGILAAMVFGLVVALPALRLRADYLAIVTIAFSEIARFTFLSTAIKRFDLFGVETGLGGGAGLVLNTTPPLEWVLRAIPPFVDASLWGPYLEFVAWFGTTIGIERPKAVVDNLVYAVVLLAFVGAFYWLLQRIGRSPFGRVLKAVREDEDAARSLGKNTNWFKIQSFMVGTGLMGLVGVLWFYDQGAINPNNFRPRLTFYVWIALIIGGAGSNTGSVMGGAVFAGLLFRGPVYVKNLVTTTFELGAAPRTIAGAVGPLLSPLYAFESTLLNAVAVLAFLGVVVGIVLATGRATDRYGPPLGRRIAPVVSGSDVAGSLSARVAGFAGLSRRPAVWGRRLVGLAGVGAFLLVWAVLFAVGGDPLPLAAYALGDIQQLQLVFMGAVLVWLMQNRPEGMLGHRSEEAAAIDLSTSRPATDGGSTDE